jgi:hypothetical protein
LISALKTHIVTNSEKREKEKTNQKLKQVIKNQTKDKTRSLDREKSRPPKARAMTQYNQDKMLQNC